MSINSRIKERREALNMSRTELAEKIGVTASAVANYENELSSPKVEVMFRIFDALKCDANYLYQDDLGSNYPMKVSYDEMEHIKKYRALDSDGQSHVDTVLRWETARVTALLELERRQSTVIEFDGQPDVPARYIQYYQKVSAGTGEVIYEDILPERITIPDIPKYRRVSYALKVSGRSMEPLFHDGDMLLIEPTCIVDVGEIGIFNVDGKAFVKKRGETELISLNEGYGNVPLTNESRCMGRVVDKYVVD